MSKDLILSEIRRCAEASGGVPPGWRKFEAETGISQSDWAGRYWARWGDALREAGFDPNVMKQPYSDDHLLQNLALLTNELGRFPTNRELRLRRRQDPGFPSDKVFGRLGNKRQLIARLVAFCEGHEDLADVRAICLDTVATVGPPEEPDPEPGRRGRELPPLGVVYLMKSGRHYKIGRSNSAGRRAYELAIQLPESLKVIHAIETDDPPGIERYWHERFADRRANGEWFAVTSEDVAAFRRRKRFM